MRIGRFADGNTNPNRIPDTQIEYFTESDNIRLAPGIYRDNQAGRSRIDGPSR
jgi:hypothetical protein